MVSWYLKLAMGIGKIKQRVKSQKFRIVVVFSDICFLFVWDIPLD